MLADETFLLYLRLKRMVPTGTITKPKVREELNNEY
jgi:hypothetical protein